MTSLGPILLVLVLLVRAGAAANRRASAGERGEGPQRHPPLVPGFGSGDLVRGATWVGALTAAGEEVWAGAGIGLVLALAATFPTVSARGLLRVLPLRAALDAATLVAPHWSRGDERAWAVLVALESPHVPRSEAALATLRARLARPAQPLPITLYARAAFADANGEDVEARDLMEALHELPPAPAVWPVQARARVWLLVRAATRGFRSRADELAEAGDAPVQAVARALAGLREGRRPGWWEHGVLATWYRQPRLARALREVPLRPPPPPPGGPPPDLSPLATALWWQRRCCLAVPTDAELRTCGQAWDVLPSLPEVMDHVTARCEAVGLRPAVDPDEGDSPPALRILSQAWQEAVRQLAAVAVLSRALPPDAGATLGAARRVAREQLFKELADHAATLTGAARDEIVADPVLAWLRFHRLRTVVDTLQRGAPVGERALAFEGARGPVLSTAAWLFNERGQRFLAHQMMRWLEGAGTGVMSPELEETMRKNVALGY